MRTRKTIIFTRGFGFIPDACRECNDFVCGEPYACSTGRSGSSETELAESNQGTETGSDYQDSVMV
jgi:hypothetical protein